MSVKAWVVGKSGLVGTDMVKYLEMQKVPFVSSGSSEVDITDIESIRGYCERHKPSHIINCSAYVLVDKAEDEGREKAYGVNVKGVANLATVAKEKGIRLIHISTDFVFDGENKRDYKEADPVHPAQYYGLTKAEGEQKMLEIYPEGVVVRTATIFGTGKEGHVSGVIQMLENQEEVSGIADQTSTPTYSWHIVRALWDLRDQKGIFHFVNKGFASRFELVEEVKQLAEQHGVPIKCQRVKGITSASLKRPARRPKRTVLSTEKVRGVLTWEIPTWQQALVEYLVQIKWLKKAA